MLNIRFITFIHTTPKSVRSAQHTSKCVCACKWSNLKVRCSRFSLSIKTNVVFHFAASGSIKWLTKSLKWKWLSTSFLPLTATPILSRGRFLILYSYNRMPFEIQRQSVFRCAYIGKYVEDSIAAIPFALKLRFDLLFRTNTICYTHTNTYQSNSESQWSDSMPNRICTFLCVCVCQFKKSDDNGDPNPHTNIFNSFHKYA